MVTKKARISSPAKQRARMRFAKGRRPFFFDEPGVDKLLAMVMALTGEMAVLRDRLDTHEQLAAAKKVASPANIEAFEISAELEDQREKRRAAMLARVFRILALDEGLPDSADKNYQTLVDKFAEK